MGWVTFRFLSALLWFCSNKEATTLCSTAVGVVVFASAVPPFVEDMVFS